MAQPGASQSPIITLDQLIALNDEIAALVRAGVPLERGLRDLGGDMPGRLGKLSQVLADRMAQGASLDEVLDENPRSFPPMYRAVVKAGVRSGRLSAALESVAHTARRLTEARRMVAAGMAYPLLVFLVAWLLLGFFAMRIAPGLAAAFDDLQWPGRRLLEFTLAWRATLVPCWMAVPPALVVLAGLWWYLTGRAGLLQSRWGDILFGWLPWLGPMVRWLRTATFAEVLGVLVEHGVPLDEAMTLAAEATGTARMRQAAAEIADSIRRGEPFDRRAAGVAGFPPLVQWLLESGYQRGMLPASLRHAAESCHRRAVWQADMARTLLPTLLTLVVGGSVTFLYGLLLFWPYTSLLYALGRM